MNEDDSLEREDFDRLAEDQKLYIVKALDFGLPRDGAMDRWARRGLESALELARLDIYMPIPEMRERLLDAKPVTARLKGWDLIRRCVSFDCQWEPMRTVAAFRFLYERLFGPPIRPWITSLYLAEVTSPGALREWREACISSVTAYDLDDHDDMSPNLFFPDLRDL